MGTILRFFHVVDSAPIWTRVLTATLALYGAAVVWMDPSGADSALAALLLWQMLSASRGFAGLASAGHFDAILTRERRWRIALAHLAHSTGAVITVWAFVAMTEFLMGIVRPLAFEPGRLAALAFVSAGAWAFSLGTTRLVSGALWIGALLALAVTPIGLNTYTSMTQRAAGPAQWLHALLLSMACPFLMIDVALPMRDGVAAGLGVGALVMTAAGMAFIVRRNYPLEPSS